jgi:hypothetical protein
MTPESKSTRHSSRIRGTPLGGFIVFLTIALLILVLTSPALASSTYGTWTSTGNMTLGRSHHLAERLNDGRVLVASGYTDAAAATAEIYDPVTGTWSSTGSLNFAHLQGTMTKLDDGRVLVVGGSASRYANLPLATAEIYDPASGAWSVTGSLNQARSRHAAALLADGRVLILGVQGGTRQNWLYDPNSDSFTWAGSTAALRLESTATLLNNGQVLHAGGHPYSLLSPYSSADRYALPGIEPTPTPTPPANGSHVGDLDGSSFSVNSRYWGASVTITILDDNGIPVADANVSGNWSGGISGNAACTTSGSGTCTVTSSNVRKNKGSVVFAVSNVGHATLVYNPEANRDPDGDSDGTTITVSRP